MSAKLRTHIRSNIIGYVALFFALSTGSAVALNGSNTVFTDDIVNDQVYSADVRNDTLTGGGLAAADLKPASVGTSEVAADSLGAGDLAPSSVGTSEVVNNSLTGSDIVESSLSAPAMGCQSGLVLGSARFDENAMTNDPTYSTSGVEFPYNCAGGTVEASRISDFAFRMRFNGLAASWAVCGSVSDGDTALSQAVGVGRITPGHWRVEFGASPSRIVCIVV